MSDDFKPIDYPRVNLPALDAPLTAPAPATDIFDMPVSQRVIRDNMGKPTGGFTRTGTYLTLYRRHPERERALYPGGIDDIPV